MIALPESLLIMLVDRVGLLIGLAFLATRSRTFQRLMTGGTARWEKLGLGLVFGLFGILGTYTGVIVRPEGIDLAHLVAGEILPQEAIANSRATSVVVAGLVGGPWTGLVAGLIAGGHRLSIGGFTGVACAVATCLQGFLSGQVRQHFYRNSGPTTGGALLVGLLMEIIQMGIILSFARPYAAAVQLVRMIALPMILANGGGIALFLAITRSIISAEAALEADAARNALAIATRTLAILGKGLNQETARATANVIRTVTDVTAVALTDTEQILAHVGLAEEHHKAGHPLLTRITRQALEKDRVQVAEEAGAIECKYPGCPLQGVVVVPLHVQDRVAGALKLYFDPARSRPPLDLAEGLAYHFSTQLTLAQAQERAALLQKAEIRALQAQIQPHFLFNALNAVMALIRLDPMRAREVLGHLAEFLRQNLHATQEETVPLAQEIEHLRNYLAVEQARYGERLQVEYQVADLDLDLLLPPLTLQPLVENAIVHGLTQVKGPWLIRLSTVVRAGEAEIRLTDNGRGIEPERLTGLLRGPVGARGERSGLALYNVHQRLQALYGPEAGLRVESEPGKGTTVTIRLPTNRAQRKEEAHGDPSTGRR